MPPGERARWRAGARARALAWAEASGAVATNRRMLGDLLSTGVRLEKR